MMKVLIALALACLPAAALAQQPVTVTVTVATAQESAETMARTGVLRHCGRAGGRREGIGFSPVSADAAIKNCCFWGKYRVREVGVARGRKGYYAVVWYE
jgi:hypothetical protein